MKFHYELNPKTYNDKQFLMWLQKDKISRAKESVQKNLLKFQERKSKFDADPNEDNYRKMMNFSNRLDLATKRRDAISQILNYEIKNGPIFEEFKQEFLAPKKSRNKLNTKDVSYFSDQKGYVEKYQETYDFLDSLKRSYAELLNKYLVENCLVSNNSKLFTYVPSGPNYITNHEMRMWELSFDELQRVNRKIKEIFNADKDFFYRRDKSFTFINPKKQRLIVHEYKRELKTEFNLRKKEFALNYGKAEVWVDGWLRRLDHLKTNFAEFLASLVGPKMFNANWRKFIRTKLLLFWQEIKQDIKIPEGYQVINVNFDSVEPKSMTVEEIINAQQDLKSSDEGAPVVLTKKPTQQSPAKEQSAQSVHAQNTDTKPIAKPIAEPTKKATQITPAKGNTQKPVEAKQTQDLWQLGNHDAFIEKVFSLSGSEIDKHLESISDSDLEKEFIFFVKDFEFQISGNIQKHDRQYSIILEDMEYKYSSSDIKSILWDCYEQGILIDVWLQNNSKSQSVGRG